MVATLCQRTVGLRFSNILVGIKCLCGCGVLTVEAVKNIIFSTARLHGLTIKDIFLFINISDSNVLGPPLWSSGHSSRLHMQRSRVQFPAL
jgi:hypothetical protein